MNQAFYVELVSKNIPSNYRLYVKEHPGMFTSHARKIEFYKTLQLNHPEFDITVNLIDILIF